ncbi:hypothetical protein CLOM621_09026 [Clostridium sp. M62/1]|nr:hypothetical protein CLOM621_09026 [Clostridium sp. M62/1]
MFNGGFRALHDAVLCIALGARHHNSAFFIISWLCQDVKRGDGKIFLRSGNRRGIFIPAKSQISLSCSWDGYGIFSGSGEVPGLEKGRERQNFSEEGKKQRDREGEDFGMAGDRRELASAYRGQKNRRILQKMAQYI